MSLTKTLKSYFDRSVASIYNGSSNKHPIIALNALKNIIGDDVTIPYLSMGGEDFSYFAQQVPACFFFVGSSPANKDLMSVPHHCSHFDIDEESMLIGASVFAEFIELSIC